jgi:hypothetical protein
MTDEKRVKTAVATSSKEPRSKKSSPSSRSGSQRSSSNKRGGDNNNILDALDEASVRAFDCARIGFSDPKKQGRDAYLCPAYVEPSSQLQMRLHLHVLRVLPTTKDTVSIVARVPRHVTKFLSVFDEHCLDAALQNTDRWFMHSMTRALIEDFFKASTEVSSRDKGIVARFRVALSDTEMVPMVHDGTSYDMTFKCMGLQFRRQTFAALWKITSCSSIAQQPLAFQSPDGEVDEDDDADSQDCDLILPGQEELHGMLADMEASLRVLRQEHSARSQFHAGIVEQADLLLGRVQAAAVAPTVRLVDALSEDHRKVIDMGDKHIRSI